MTSLSRSARWRLFALIGTLAAVAVAIPVASGASAHAKLRPSALNQSRLVVAPTVLKANKSSAGKTCAGGSLAAGKYSSLTITGFCTVDAGVVVVVHNLTVAPNAGRIAAFGGGPRLVVGGNLVVKTNGVLILGCEPEVFTCINDPDQQLGTLASSGTVFGSLEATKALAVLVHYSSVGQNLQLAGGGGGLNCNNQAALNGSPAYATVEDVSVGGNMTITGWRTCWLGVFRTAVSGNARYQNNVTADPDGNEIQTNNVKGNFGCTGNNPVPQRGDSDGTPSVVFGLATGQCAALVRH